MTLPFIPIYSYSNGSSKAEIICKYYYAKVADRKDVLGKFTAVISQLMKFSTLCKIKNESLSHNNLFYEVLYWATDIILSNNIKINDEDIEKIFKYIDNADDFPLLWNRIINNPQKSVELIFESTGSHYYSAINNRYNFIANIFYSVFAVDFQRYIKIPLTFRE